MRMTRAFYFLKRSSMYYATYFI